MRAALLEVRVGAADLARVEAFVDAWRAFHSGTRADALRGLVRLGLDTAARPGAHDERWHDLHERLARVEALLDALGRAVSATPALVAWLIAHAPARDDSAPSADALADSLEALLDADWDERCRARGLPRPRVAAPRSHRPAFGVPADPPETAPTLPRQRLVATTVRLAPRDHERAAAHAARVQLGRQAALADLVRRGLDVAEAEAARDDIAALLDSARRIEQQLDAIGSLATSPTSVTAHLWRRIAGLSEEWERILLHEVAVVAEATWRSLQAGPPQAVPAKLALDPGDETEGDGWPT